jgi:endonuclease/exonuclease/phosphatase family metal-dependent hydrolase
MPILRVVSYNIHKGRSPLGSRNSLKELRLGLYGLQPDLVFLQEVQGRNENRSMLDAQHMSLAAALRMNVCYGRNAIRHQTDHGNALLSRFPILDHENQDISDHRLEQRGILHARITIGDCEVHCFVVHLGLLAGSRVRQIQALVDRIDRLVPMGAPMVIAGDFNDWADRLAPLFVQRLRVHEVFSYASRLVGGEGPPRLRDTMYRLGNVFRRERKSLARQKLKRAHQLTMQGSYPVAPSPRTFPAAFPWFRLDRIYQRGFAVRSARVLRGLPWAKLSDHSPLLAELELP